MPGFDGSGLSEEQLKRARLLAEAESFSRREKNQKINVTNNNFARYAKFAVAFWAIRAGLLGVGFGAASITEFLVWLSGTYTGTGDEMVQNIANWTFADTQSKYPAASVLRRGLPFVISGVPLADDDNIFTLLKRHPFLPIQYSLQSLFTYESAQNRGWSAECASAFDHGAAHCDSPTRLPQRVPAESIQAFPYNSLNKNGGGSDAKRESTVVDITGAGVIEEHTVVANQPSSREYWYVSEKLKGGLHNPLLQAISPDFVAYLQPLATELPAIHANLWTASAGASCASHYDTDDNFFLQIRGTKRIIIADPSARDVYHPHCALHPRWRQARRTLSRPDDIRAAALKQHDLRSSPPATRALPKVWEVTLKAGEMLYIPAFYFHTVTTQESDGASVNVWVTSTAVKAADKLMKEVELPFPVSDEPLGEPVLGWDGQPRPIRESDARLKLRLLARTAKLVYESIAIAPETSVKKKSSARNTQRGQLGTSLRELMLQRYARVEPSSGAVQCSEQSNTDPTVLQCSSLDQLDAAIAPICTGVDLGLSEEALRTSDRAVRAAVDILRAVPSTVVRVTLLLDHIDNVFALVAAEVGANSPYAAEAFAAACF